jgi:osmotically-inducible protein OsmY
VASATPSMPGSHRIDDVDDVTLARKVETEIFRDADAPKGQVSVDVQAGVVYLRGVIADDAWIERLADGAKKIDGVKGVKNLLHRPGTPAPAAEPRGAVHDRL